VYYALNAQCSIAIPIFSVHLSVTLTCHGHVGWVISKLIIK